MSNKKSDFTSDVFSAGRQQCPYAAEDGHCRRPRKLAILDLYDRISDMQSQLQLELMVDAQAETRKPDPEEWRPMDYKKVHALSATYTLLEYVAGEIALMRAMGVLPPDMVPDTVTHKHQFSEEFNRKMHEICPSIDLDTGEEHKN